MTARKLNQGARSLEWASRSGATTPDHIRAVHKVYLLYEMPPLRTAKNAKIKKRKKK